MAKKLLSRFKVLIYYESIIKRLSPLQERNSPHLFIGDLPITSFFRLKA